MRNGIELVCCLVLAASTGQAQLADGVYAVFTTDFGSFTTRLDHVEAPLTVGNFVGLAEGTQTWIEETTGIPRNHPYFDGILVNRIADIPERIIQSGSQNGTNSGGGPGYTFPDEFHPNLRHDVAGILSMANSGPHSNGSQIFFTLGPLPGLDDVHSVFGEVIDGLDVLTAIGNVPLNGVKPATDVPFHQVQIVRVGAAAQAFDAGAQGLPVVAGLDIGILPEDADSILITYQTNRNSELHINCSPDLQDPLAWTEILTQWQFDNHPTNQLAFTVTNQLEFFCATRVDYAGDVYTPFDLGGLRLRDSADEIDVRLSQIDDAGYFQVVQGMFSSFLNFWSWTPGPYGGNLFLNYSGFTPPQTSLDLIFTNSTSGTYQAEILNSNGSVAFGFDGTFTLSGYEQADLSIVKASSQASGVAGAAVTYTLTVQNNGPSNATDVLVSDILPPGTTFDAAGSSPECALVNPGVVECQLGSISNGNQLVVTVRVDVASSAVGALTNVAEVIGSSDDILLADNRTTHVTPIVVEADLQLAVVETPDPVAPGELLTYTLTVSNAGPSDAEGVVVTNAFPAAVSFLNPGSDVLLLLPLDEPAGAAQFADTSILGNDATCVSGACPTAEVPGAFGTAVRFDGVNDRITIADGGALSFGNGVGDSPLTFSAWINLDDVSIFRILGKSRAGGGIDREYLFTFSGAGALNLFLYDGDSANYIRQESTQLFAGLEGAWHQVAATYDGSGTAAGITLYVDGSPIASTATTVGTYVAMSNLGLDCTIGSWIPGNDFADGAMDEVRVYNRPLGESEIGALFNNGPSGCSETGGIVTCGPYAMPAGDSLVIALEGTVDPVASGLLTAVAGVSSGVTDPVPSNNTVVVETAVWEADVQIMLADSVDPVNAGQVLTYLMTVSNAGPFDAEGVVTTQALPAEVTYLSGAVVTPDMRLFLNLDESVGATTYRDESGAGNHGTCSGGGCPTAGVAGLFGRALGFDGVDDQLTIADGGDLSFGDGVNDTPFSVSAWVNPVDVTTFRILSKSRTGGGSDVEYLFSFDGTDRLNLFLYDDTIGNNVRRQSNLAYTSLEGGWHHVAATYDGSGTAAGIRLYVDGGEVSSTSFSTGSYVAMSDLGIGCAIGAWVKGSSFAQGAMDAVIVQDRVLSGSDVAELLNEPCSETGGVVTCGPVGLPAGETRVISVTGTVDPGAFGVLSATAGVTSTTTDLVPGNNTDAEDTTVTP